MTDKQQRTASNSSDCRESRSTLPRQHSKFLLDSAYLLNHQYHHYHNNHHSPDVNHHHQMPHSSPNPQFASPDSNMLTNSHNHLHLTGAPNYNFLNLNTLGDVGHRFDSSTHHQHQDLNCYHPNMGTEGGGGNSSCDVLPNGNNNNKRFSNGHFASLDPSNSSKLLLSPQAKYNRHSYSYDANNNNNNDLNFKDLVTEQRQKSNFADLGQNILSNGSSILSLTASDEPVNLTGDEKTSVGDGAVKLPGFNSPESAFYQYQNRMEGQKCQVCGELAAGFHHGAYVCEACKKFFMRHSMSDTKPTNVCPTGGNCPVAKGSRGKCQICRYRKCLMVGMKIKDPESQSDIDISNIPCRVCGGRSSGFHFGALTCEGCKGFFRRTEGCANSLVCVGGQNACTITPRSRNACKSCRFRRCLVAGMSKKGSRIGRQPNAVKFHCAIEIKQLQSVHHRGSSGSNGGDPSGGSSSSTNDALSPGGPSVKQQLPFCLDLVSNNGGPLMPHPSLSSVPNSDHRSMSPDLMTLSAAAAALKNNSLIPPECKPPLSLLFLLPSSAGSSITTNTTVESTDLFRRKALLDQCVDCEQQQQQQEQRDATMPSSSVTSSKSAFGSKTSLGYGCSNSSPFSRYYPTPVAYNCPRPVPHQELSRPQCSADMWSPTRLGSNHCNEDFANLTDPRLFLESNLLNAAPSRPYDISHQHETAFVHVEPRNHSTTSQKSNLVSTSAGVGAESAGHKFPSGSSDSSFVSNSPSHLMLNSIKLDQHLDFHSATYAGILSSIVGGRTGSNRDVGTSSSSSGGGGGAEGGIKSAWSGLVNFDDPIFWDETEEDVLPQIDSSPEAVAKFTDGMRTATEFLRLPNTYFKTRFRMTSIPPEHRDNVTQIWGHMMNHFHMHAQQIVQFAKLVPGFNQLGITARSNLVRESMYPVVLLLLSRDYQPETDEFNYFDFTFEEREIIMQHFPSFRRITEHLRVTGRLFNHLGLSLTELSMSCAVEILRNYRVLEEPMLSRTAELFVLVHCSLLNCMTKQPLPPDTSLQQRWTQLLALRKMLQNMHKEHRQILTDLMEVRSNLKFPELYVEMFQLADSASAIFSASVQVVTLACSGALQSLAQLPNKNNFVSNSTSHCITTSNAVSTSNRKVDENEAKTEQTTTDEAAAVDVHQTSTSKLKPSGDRWDAGRLALAVPAAVAAVAAMSNTKFSKMVHPDDTSVMVCDEIQDQQLVGNNVSTPTMDYELSDHNGFDIGTQQPTAPITSEPSVFCSDQQQQRQG